MPLHDLGLLLLLQELRLRRFYDWMLEHWRLSLPPSRLLHRIWSLAARMRHDYGRKRVLQGKSLTRLRSFVCLWKKLKILKILPFLALFRLDWLLLLRLWSCSARGLVQWC